MKLISQALTLTLVSILTFGIYSFHFNESSPTDNKVIDLKTAINSGLIDAKITSNGKYSGKSVNLNVTNKQGKTLTIRVPAGTTYAPADNGEQTLIQLEEQILVLQPRGSQQKLVAAFCTEASDRCPSKSGTFKLGSNKNPKLKELITYLDNKKIDKSVYQDAVWTITDNKPVSYVYAEDAPTKEFRKYLAKLTGQKDTWYSSPQEYTVDNRGHINSETVIIEGELVFDSDGVSPIHQELCDADGNMLFKSNASTPRKSKEVTMNFKVRVKGWEVGDYMVKVMKGDEELKRFPFKV